MVEQNQKITNTNCDHLFISRQRAHAINIYGALHLYIACRIQLIEYVVYMQTHIARMMNTTSKIRRRKRSASLALTVLSDSLKLI